MREDEPRERDEYGADRDADNAAEECEHDGFNEELLEDVAVGRADGLAEADSRVRSMTDTSMMFMMPMPPTTREMDAIAARKSVRTDVMLPRSDKNPVGSR